MLGNEDVCTRPKASSCTSVRQVDAGESRRVNIIGDKGMKTEIQSYRFDLRDSAQKAAYAELKTRLKVAGLTKFCTYRGKEKSHFLPKFAEVTEIELDTKYLFKNQWNTACGLRVFDWAEDYQNYDPQVRQGHYLVQTWEMCRIRDTTYQCGYCGAYYVNPAEGFCDKCLGSEYLKPTDLYLLRLIPISSKDGREALTNGEWETLLVSYKAHQKARLLEKAWKITADQTKKIADEQTTMDGYVWLLERGIDVDNVIFYAHESMFCFGWRHRLTAIESAELISELDRTPRFSWPYRIKGDL